MVQWGSGDMYQLRLWISGHPQSVGTMDQFKEPGHGSMGILDPWRGLCRNGMDNSAGIYIILIYLTVNCRRKAAA